MIVYCRKSHDFSVSNYCIYVVLFVQSVEKQIFTWMQKNIDVVASQIISSVSNKGFQVKVVNFYFPVAQFSICTNLVL
jgi:hypothetical protein